MKNISLADLQASVQDRTAFKALEDYTQLATAFLDFLGRTKLTRIVSPSHHNYVFYRAGYRLLQHLNRRPIAQSQPFHGQRTLVSVGEALRMEWLTC